MQYLLFGIAAVLLFLVASHKFVQANPAVLARQLRVGSGVVALGASAILLLRGMTHAALWLGAFGAMMLGGFDRFIRPGGPPPRVGEASRVVTETLDVEMDHDSGLVSGRVLRGTFAGQELSSLRPVDLAQLWTDCRFADPASAQILEVYLDRMHPEWREDMARAGGGQTGEAGPGVSASGGMTREEALRVLGLEAGASEADIRRAHRILMLKLHPDLGGSDALAAKVNEAKDVLLGR